MFTKILRVLIALVVSTCVLCSAVTVLATGPDIGTTELPEGGSLAGDSSEGGSSEGGSSEGGSSEGGSSEGGSSEGGSSEGGSSEGGSSEGGSSEGGSSEGGSSQGGSSQGGSSENRPVVITPAQDELDDEPEEETTEETTEIAEGPFKVYLELNGGESEYESNELRLESPGRIPEPEDITKAGYLLDGWYRDAQLTIPWDFDIDLAQCEMTLYAKWVRDPAAILYEIHISDMDGGKITVKPERAAAGESVLIMVHPEEGKRLAKGSLTINGETSDILSFKMPAEDVYINAAFEDAPVEETEGEGAFIGIAVAGVIAALLVVVPVVVRIKRRNTIIVPEFDEDGAVIIEDNEEVWIDETIVVESGFRDGKKASDINPPKIEDDTDDFSDTEN